MVQNKRSLKMSGGFTIIEVLIVLAIAGLIMLLVFQAIPTLERNSRNSQRKQDVSLILQDVSHYELNDSGGFPDVCGAPSQPSCSSVEAGSPNNYILQFNFKKLSYYDPTIPGDVVVPAGPAANPNNKDKVAIFNYAKCDPNNIGAATTTGAGYSDIVALYALESGSSTTPQCQQL